MRGGYQIIDFQKIALSDSNTKVDGVYKAIQDNPLKVLQLNNINLGGTLKDDVFTTATKGTNKYTFDVYDGILTVTSADNVRWVSHDTIQTVISNIDDLQEETSDIKDMISDAYNAETAYTAGQYCIYNDTLYKCTADATAGTLPTDTDYFSEVTIASEISTLNSDVETIQTNLDGLTFGKIAERIGSASVKFLPQTKGIIYIIGASDRYASVMIYTDGGTVYPHDILLGDGITYVVNSRTITFSAAAESTTVLVYFLKFAGGVDPN